jgi:hypothetical protein
VRPVALAFVLVLALPTTALAVTLKPPNPTTISLSGTGAPNCTTLTFVTAKRNHRMRLEVRGPAGIVVFKWGASHVPAGTHHVTYCASGIRPGTATWLVIAWHYKISRHGTVKTGQPFTVIS